MFGISGKISYEQIDHQTNSFEIIHGRGHIFASSTSFSFKTGNTIVSFRPASVIFKEDKIFVSIGSYPLKNTDEIYYSIGYYKYIEAPRVSSSDFYSRLSILSNSFVFGEMIIVGVCPNPVVIQSDIQFDIMQTNRNPNFYWEKPENNGVEIIGYYYAFNKTKNYFITKSNSFIPVSEESNSESPIDGIIQMHFPSSGRWYFHVRAVNSIGNMSRYTSTVSVLYNAVASIPENLRTNGDVFYQGPLTENTLSWDESSNSDSDSISYNISLYKGENSVLNILTSGNTNLEEPSLSGKRYINFPYQGEQIYSGNYSWKVRAYDKWQYSDWSELCTFKIIPEHSEFYCKLFLPTYYSYPPFRGKLKILSNSYFYGFLYVYPMLFAKLRICHEKEISEFYSKLFVEMTSSFYCKMTVRGGYGFNGFMTVLKRMFYAKMIVQKKSINESFRGKMQIAERDTSNFYGKTLVRVLANSSFSAKLRIEKTVFSSKLRITQYTETNPNLSSSYMRGLCVYGKMSIQNRPNAPIITSNVGSDWQGNNRVNFYWASEPSTTPVTSYMYYFSFGQLSNVDLNNFFNTGLASLSVDLDILYGSGEYYLYVCARGANGSYSNVSSYIVRYNKPPVSPGSVMLVNGNDSINASPIISRSMKNIFSWNRIVSLDDDPITYELRISDKANMSNIVFSSTGIQGEITEDIVSKDINYVYTNIGTFYYWQVRSYDGKQYSEYSRIASFRVNTPPSQPTNLTVGV